MILNKAINEITDNINNVSESIDESNINDFARTVVSATSVAGSTDSAIAS